MAELIDAALMESLTALDESAMPGVCTVFTRTITNNSRGGSTAGTWSQKNATPMKCRISAGNGNPAGSVRSRLVGEQLTTLGDVTLQIALTAIKAQSVTIDDDDEIEVTTVVKLPGADLTQTQRYKVIGLPSVGSYATNLAVPCVKVS